MKSSNFEGKLLFREDLLKNVLVCSPIFPSELLLSSCSVSCSALSEFDSILLGC
ncbi:hypothetical protein HanRHA438_Chr17g0839541 [Helianthus annuus]|nr:hypothetical protein HanRHA438_Chr17g0839541 [Helianthus annuus]